MMSRLSLESGEDAGHVIIVIVIMIMINKRQWKKRVEGESFLL